MTCTPVACPPFEEVTFSDVRPIGWQGVNMPVIEPAPRWSERGHDQQVQDLIGAIQEYAQDIRDRYRYSPNTLIAVGLPTNSSIQPVIDEVRTTEIDGLLFRDAR